MQSKIKISFGIIVLNGEPFTKYALRQIYPYAHEIIIVEGGSRKAIDVAPNGKSIDGTIESIAEFIEKEDASKKIKFISAKGFWKDKDEQSSIFFREATGDYVWEIDIDEFYKNKDIEHIINLLEKNPDIDAISFEEILFWGGFNYKCDGIFLRDVFTEVFRIFKWRPGYKYVGHRPPTVLDENGINLKDKMWITGKRLAKQKIYMYHYCLVFPKQVKEKSNYYSRPQEASYKKMNSWAQDSYFSLKKPFNVHNIYKYPSWLTRYSGNHPEQIQQMNNDIISGNLKIETRSEEDVRAITNSFYYKLIRFILLTTSKLEIFKALLMSYFFIKRKLPIRNIAHEIRRVR